MEKTWRPKHWNPLLPACCSCLVAFETSLNLLFCLYGKVCLDSHLFFNRYRVKYLQNLPLHQRTCGPLQDKSHSHSLQGSRWTFFTCDKKGGSFPALHSVIFFKRSFSWGDFRALRFTNMSRFRWPITVVYELRLYSPFHCHYNNRFVTNTVKC